MKAGKIALPASCTRTPEAAEGLEATLRLLGVQTPQLREALQVRIALHGLERLHGVVLLAALQLRDAQQQVCLCLVSHAALGQCLVQLVGSLVVLLVADISE